MGERDGRDPARGESATVWPVPSRSPRREGVLVSLELARRRSGAAVDGRVPGPAAVQGGRLIVPPSWVASAWAVPAQGGFSPVPPGAA